MRPLSFDDRNKVIDILRGWALLGVTLGNYVHFYYFDYQPDKNEDVLTLVLGYIMRFGFAGKSWSLLSVLFGYGFSVLLAKHSRTGTRPKFFFPKRIFWLFVFAFFNTLFFPGDILRDYALLGILLLCFTNLKTKTLLSISIGLLFLVPAISAYIVSLQISFKEETNALVPLFYSDNWFDVFRFNLLDSYFREILNPHYAVTVHIVMMVCMLAGVAAHRTDFFSKIQTDKELVKRIFWATLVSAIILNVAILLLFNNGSVILKYWRFGNWATVSSMAAIASGICWLHMSGKLNTFFEYLSITGRMTLTHYVTHCLLSVILFSGAGFRIFNTMPLWFYILLGLVIYVLQVFLSRWWFSYFHYGPLEWLWRTLSYGHLVSDVKKPVHEIISKDE